MGLDGIGRFAAIVAVRAWVSVTIGVTAAVVTPFFFRRGADAHPDDPRLGARQKTPWLPPRCRSRGWRRRGTHAKKLLYLRTLQDFDCFSTIQTGVQSLRNIAPSRRAMRRNSAQFIAHRRQSVPLARIQTVPLRHRQGTDPRGPECGQEGPVTKAPEHGSLAGRCRRSFTRIRRLRGRACAGARGRQGRCGRSAPGRTTTTTERTRLAAGGFAQPPDGAQRARSRMGRFALRMGSVPDAQIG
jgi:hypothetical protein